MCVKNCVLCVMKFFLCVITLIPIFIKQPTVPQKTDVLKNNAKRHLILQRLAFLALINPIDSTICP
jgi:hypothetical protein